MAVRFVRTFSEAQLRRMLRIMIFCVVFVTLLSNFRQELDNLYYFINYARCSTYPNFTRIQYSANRSSKLVLFYTSYFGKEIWPHSGVGLSWNLTGENGQQCLHNCLITYNKCDLPSSDAVVFHEADLPRARTFKSIEVYMRRNPQQRWVYLTHENPHNANHDPAMYDGIFNWTITYRRDSDVFYPDGYYREIQSPSNNSTQTNYAKGKDKLIVWAASHCGCLRDEVVAKLMKFLPITVIGRCSKVFKQTTPSFCNRGSIKCAPFLKGFKFYLAFENAMCYDYITEKYWETPFDNDMIPIVLGSNYEAAMPGSYINVLDFKSIRDLSNYLKYLDQNDTAYNEYFRWKTKFIRFKPGQESWTCQLCAKLHNNTLPKKVYKNLGAYWGIESNCERRLVDRIKQIIAH